MRRAAFAALLWGATLVAQAADVVITTDTPEATIATLQRGLVAASQQSPHATADERYKALEPLILATHDLPYIALGAAAEAGRAQVTTAVARAGQSDVSFEYLLRQGGGGEWRIVNIVADGVSDLALKRAEYQRILANGTLDSLIKELEAQTERLRQR